MYPDQMIRNGGTAYLQSNRKNFVDQDTPSATTVKYLQNATHHMCYMVVNSNAMNGIASGSKISYSLAPWQMGAATAVALAALLLIAAIGMTVYKVQDQKKHPEMY